MRYILREFPLDPLAAGAFMLARCAGKDKYFPLVETLFQQQRNWVVQKPIEPLFAIAKQAGFTQQTLRRLPAATRRCSTASSGCARAAPRSSRSNSTPTFFINGKIFKGALSIEDLAKAIDPLLKS